MKLYGTEDFLLPTKNELFHFLIDIDASREAAVGRLVDERGERRQRARDRSNPLQAHSVTRMTAITLFCTSIAPDSKIFQRVQYWIAARRHLCYEVTSREPVSVC